MEEEGAYADRALAGEAGRAHLEPRELGLATRLAFGAIQRKRTLDHVISTLARRPVERLDGPVRDALRLGVLQLLFLDGIPPHAAVDQSVELAKAAGGPGFKLVNAVLRATTREGPGLIAALDDATPHGAALRHSVPDWLAELWWDALGADEARALLGRINEPAESALRVNTLVATREQVLDALASRGVAARPVDDLPEAILLDAPFALTNDPLWEQGALVAQSRGAMLAARLLDPAPGHRVLDLCAAPGGKATHLAALIEDDGVVVAVERHPGRAEALRRTVARTHATSVRVETADAAIPRADGPFDAVLVDPPCSGLGTLQGRPDLRWRARPEAIPELAALQREILTAGARALRAGGALLYATCTISPQEGEEVVEAFLRANSGFALEDLGARHPAQASPREPRTLQLLPHRDGTDGFFYAAFRRDE